MVKKKTTETVDNKEKTNTETTEYKDNATKTAAEIESKEEVPEEEALKENPPESETGEKTESDKKTSEEKLPIEKLAEMQDRYLRLSAEFDNYRKRTLKQHGVKEIESLNTGFNVDLHDAVAKIPVAEEDKKGKIIEVILKGYYLQDKV